MPEIPEPTDGVSVAQNPSAEFKLGVVLKVFETLFNLQQHGGILTGCLGIAI